MAALERELQHFAEECRKQLFNEIEMRYICQPLVWHMRLTMLKRWTQWLLLPAILAYLLWNYCDTCAWTASAVGRLMLIQVLPYWNWTPYYNAKCLIERVEQYGGEQKSGPKTLDRHETMWENCVLCESLEHIPALTNVTYSTLESEYLERGLPVIVTDCHLEMDLESLLLRIQKTPELVISEPCDVTTNLLLRQLFNLDAALQKIRAFHSSPLPSWHLQFRNCESSAVKASRLYASRPYFYPSHLEPYYSSWLLLAHNVRRPQVAIYVRGLIFVQQLSGQFEYRLRPKQPCHEGVCPNLSLRLRSGECLAFSTDLWRLTYGLQNSDSSHSSIATVLEVNWQL